MNRTLPVVAAVLVAALAMQCKRPDSTSSTSTTAGTTATDKSALSAGDKQFIEKAAQGGRLEVMLGREVEKKATSADVKAFAHRMVTDHGRTNDELKVLADKKSVTVPTELDSEHAKTLMELSALSGAKLDKEYIDDMVDDHEDDVADFREAAKKLSDPELRAWADRTLPVLESHLTAAKEIEAKMKHHTK